ncbi:MAG: EAL domain-containing protein, partial [Actinomycetota bacterium]
ALLPIVGAWALMRRHGVLFQRHSDLRDLHTFGRLLARDLRFDAVADDALAEIGRLVGAADVSLALDTTEHADGHVWIHGAPIPASGAPIPDPEATTSPTDAVGTSFSLPVVSEDGPLGMLSLGGSLRRPPVFVRNDVDRARDLADQLASSLRNGMLHTEVQRAATIDALTGHANRLDFERLLSERLQHISSAECTGVLVIDLNGFKHVNETLGHHVGDQVLVEFARRVALLLDEREVLARFSGDEFGVLATRTSREDLRQLADQIVTMSYRGLELPSCDAVVTASVGLAVATELDVDPAAVIRRADIAMRAAKHQRRGVEEYRDEIDRRTPARLTLLGDLRAAIERDDLDVYYQPKIDLRSDTIIGAEALLRWEPTGRGAITPAEFIGVAEESGIVRLLSDVVLTKAIRRARRWRDLGFALDVSINLSALDLQDDSLVDRVSGRLEEHGLAARHVVFEITESALMVDSERATATIERLDLLGVRLSLDDFGTGYSSLSHLRRLPVSELKIDRSFVRDLLLNVSDDVIVRSTIDLGHNLGLRVVAEGIENAQIGEHLARLGCDVGQGFAVSRPLAPDLFERWLDTTVHDVARIPVEPASI